jgi:hypothetical protein
MAGTFRVDAGRCALANATPTGSYLVVLNAGGGKSVTNPGGGCVNPNYTPLTPGRDGGVVLGDFQPNAQPTFDEQRNSLSDRIINPVAFGPYKLGMATDAHDEQNAPGGTPAFPPPSAERQGRQLHADLRSITITYGGPAGTTCSTAFGVGCWNLGSRSAVGTYDPATKHFAVEWQLGETFAPAGDSLIVHLEGTFIPSPSPSKGNAAP